MASGPVVSQKHCGGEVGGKAAHFVMEEGRERTEEEEEGRGAPRTR